MTEIELCAAIRSRCEEILKDLLVVTYKEVPDRATKGKIATTTENKVDVINGFLPPKRSDRDDDDFPFLIVRPSSGSTEQVDSSTVSVKLLIGCQTEKFDGHEYPLLILSRLRNGLMQKPILDNQFRFELPLSWKMYDDQPYPEWMLEVITEWTIPTPQDTSVEGII